MPAPYARPIPAPAIQIQTGDTTVPCCCLDLWNPGVVFRHVVQLREGLLMITLPPQKTSAHFWIRAIVHR
jgi:hypothetical protein